MTNKLTFSGIILGLLFSSVMNTAAACGCNKDKAKTTHQKTVPVAPEAAQSGSQGK